MAAGKNHTCAILSDGTVKCWGNNEHGQLGNGGTEDSAVPMDVIGVTDAAAITLGWGHTCVLSRSGGVKCWGYNANGELGNSTTQDSSVPVGVIGLSTGAVAIDAGDDHTCAATSGGWMMCWGYNEFGQLGDGTMVSRSVPVETQKYADGITAVAAGWGHTCALTGLGAVKCWGNNQSGQLGYGQDADFHLTAVDVLGLGNGVMKITADGGSTCALVAGGGVKCWGSNKYGQLGDGTAEDRGSPVAVGGLSQGVIQIAAGWNHTCAVTGTGALECWGWNYYGQLGDGTKASHVVPGRVNGLTDDVTAIGVGWGHTCVVTDLGGVKCWGANENGQLGEGTDTDSAVPMAVTGIHALPFPIKTSTPTATATGTPTTIPTPVYSPTEEATVAFTGLKTTIAAGGNHTCAVTGGGGLKCWGLGGNGQLGDGGWSDRYTPADVFGMASGVAAVTAGGLHTCASSIVGGVRCWGFNQFGELGDGTRMNSGTPMDVIGLTNGVVALAAGDSHTCALIISGGVKCWGYGDVGQLGNGAKTTRNTPVDVIGLTGSIAALTAGGFHTCALTSTGGAKCWGITQHGELGDGTTVDSGTPVDVIGLTGGVKALAAGGDHTCALTDGGGVKCWGFNNHGQLGDGTTTDHGTPMDVIGLTSGVKALAAGVQQTCAVIENGGVKCWGWNNHGQLGDGTTRDRPIPVDVSGLSSGVAAVAMGGLHTCALIRGGGIKCWGENSGGRLGDGTTNNSSTPVDVIGFGGSPGTATPAAGTPFVPTKTKTSTPP